MPNSPAIICGSVDRDVYKERVSSQHSDRARSRFGGYFPSPRCSNALWIIQLTDTVKNSTICFFSFRQRSNRTNVFFEFAVNSLKKINDKQVIWVTMKTPFGIIFRTRLLPVASIVFSVFKTTALKWLTWTELKTNETEVMYRPGCRMSSLIGKRKLKREIWEFCCYG